MAMEAALKQNGPPDEGVILIDKPGGMSSFRVVKTAARILGINKAGHAGTLDPMATGLLVVCAGRATRISRFLMEGDKEYHGVMRLGTTTDTYDAEGRVVAAVELPSGFSMDTLIEAARRLTGRIMQSPPPFSAAKHKGVPLYRLARRGEMVHKEPREIVVHEFDIDDAGLPDVKFRISCSKGTYVRSLCHELGRIVGCGAHMTVLRRVRSGNFHVNSAFSLEQLEEFAGTPRVRDLLVPVNEALSHFPAVRIDYARSRRLRLGQGLPFEEFLSAAHVHGVELPETGQFDSFVRIVTLTDGNEEIVAVARPCADTRGRVVTQKIWN